MHDDQIGPINSFEVPNLLQIDHHARVAFDKYKFVVRRELVRFTHLVIDLLELGIVELVYFWPVLL